jgi:hypothetical protein
MGRVRRGDPGTFPITPFTDPYNERNDLNLNFNLNLAVSNSTSAEIIRKNTRRKCGENKSVRRPGSWESPATHTLAV